MKQSSGVLFYRHRPDGLQVLLVHPSGDYNKDSKWSIPKGEIEDGDTAFETAHCEVREEVGMHFPLHASTNKLGSARYKSGRKEVTCFACETGENPGELSWEVDKAEWFSPEMAKTIIHPDQAVFVDRLLASLQD